MLKKILFGVLWIFGLRLIASLAFAFIGGGLYAFTIPDDAPEVASEEALQQAVAAFDRRYLPAVEFWTVVVALFGCIMGRLPGTGTPGKPQVSLLRQLEMMMASISNIVHFAGGPGQPYRPPTPEANTGEPPKVQFPQVPKDSFSEAKQSEVTSLDPPVADDFRDSRAADTECP